MHTSPISTWTPVASMISPIRSLTRPIRRDRSASWIARVARPRRSDRAGASVAVIVGLALERGGDDLPGARELCVDAGVDVADVGAGDRATPSHAPVGLHAEMLDPAQLRLQLVHAIADDVEIVRVDHDGDPAAVGQVP